MTGIELTGLTRTVILAAGGAGGVLSTAAIMHGLKKWTGALGPKGWSRTLVLAGGAVFGIVATHGIIHLVKGGQGQGSLDSLIYSFLKQHAYDRYAEALAEAKKIEKETGVPMTVEAFKPVHFGWFSYKLPVGSTFITLKDKVRFYPVGIFSTDKNFTTLKWWEGAKTNYLCDWPVYYVPDLLEKQATMTPQPIFKTSFTFEVVSTGAAPDVDAWIIGWIVLPATMREMKVTR